MDENSTEKIRNELGINPISWCETPSPGTEADSGASDAAFEAAKVCPTPPTVVRHSPPPHSLLLPLLPSAVTPGHREALPTPFTAIARHAARWLPDTRPPLSRLHRPTGSRTELGDESKCLLRLPLSVLSPNTPPLAATERDQFVGWPEVSDRAIPG